MPTPEGLILDACMDLLAAHHVLSFRLNSGAVKIDDRFIRFGGVKGMSDLLALPTVSGKFKGFPVQWCEPWFLETKTAKGRQTPEQVSFERSVKDAGAQYFVIRDPSELEDHLRAHGVIA